MGAKGLGEAEWGRRGGVKGDAHSDPRAAEADSTQFKREMIGLRLEDNL